MLLATGLGAAPFGLIAGIMVSRNSERDPELSSSALVRRDGLVQDRELAIRNGCLVVALELTNPNNHRAERLRVVDPLPQQLHGAESCGGTERMTDPVVIRDGVTLGAGESRQTEYELTLPDGVEWKRRHTGRVGSGAPGEVGGADR